MDGQEYCDADCMICAYFNGDLDDIVQDADAEPFSDEWLNSINDSQKDCE